MNGNTANRDRIRAVFLAAIMVLSMVALSATFAGAATAQAIDSSERTITETEVEPGQEDIEITVTAEIDEGGDELAFTEQFSPDFADATIPFDGVQVNGEPVATQTAAASEDLAVTILDDPVEDGDTVTFTYEVDIPEDADPGTEFTISGDVTLEDVTVDTTGEDTLTVPDEPDEGLLITDVDPSGDLTADPGDEQDFDVTVESAGDTDEQDVEFNLDGDVEDSETVDLDDGESETVTLTATAPEAPGDYDWFVSTDDDTSATWTLTVADEDEDAVLFFPDQTTDSTSVYLEQVEAGAADQIEIWADTTHDGDLDSVVGTADAVNADLLTVELDTNLPAAEYDMRASMVDADGEELFGMDAAVDVVDPDKDVDDADAWEATHWEGQVLRIDLSDTDRVEGDVVQVREVLEFDDAAPSSDRLTRELPVNSNEDVIVDTARLRGEGDYLLAWEGNYFTTDGDDFSGSLGDAAVAEVLEQDLSTEIQDDEIRLQNDEIVSSDIEVESVRLRFDTFVWGTVDGDLLDEEELDSIFGENSPSSETFETPAGTPLIYLPNVQDGSDVEAQFDEDVLDDGEYEFNFDVTDSTAADSTNITVLEAVDEEVTITSPTTDDRFDRGDIIPIEIDFQGTDVGTITFGDREEGQNVEVNVTVVDEDGSGDATILLNTFQLGNADRDHGFMADGDDARIDNVTAWDGMADRLGGAFDANETDQGAVIAEASYDLVSVHGEESWKAGDPLEDDRSIVRIDERDTESFDLWTAPGTGDSELDAETVDDIAAGIEDGSVTPAGDTIADRDLLIMQMQSTGLEGLLHEALVTYEEEVEFFAGTAETPENVSSYNFGTADADDRYDIAEELTIDREDDHDVSGAFDATLWVADRQNAPESSLFGPGPIIEQVHVDGAPDPNVEQDFWFSDTRTLAGTDDSGNLNEYFIASEVNREFAGTAPLAPGTSVQSIFEVGAIAPEPTDFPLNLQFVNGEVTEDFNAQEDTITEVFESDETEAVAWDFVSDMTLSIDDLSDGVFAVPQEDDITLSGTTHIAGGTNLSIQVATVSGEDEAFVKTDSARVEHVEDGINTFETSFDFANETVGTEFNVRITRQGAGGILTFGERVPGVVTEAPAVNEFEFNDQRQGGSSVVVQSFDSTQGGFIGIYNDAGDRIGQSDSLAIGPHTNIAISLDPEIDQNQDLTAVAYMGEDRPYVDEDGNPVERTATITVEDLDEASFSVSDLDPQDVELDEPGDVVDVSATVTNDGDEEGTTDVELRIDGDTVDSQSVTLDGGESTSVTFEADTGALEHGETYIHSVWTADDDASGTISIAPEPTPTPTPEEPTPTPTPTPDEPDDDDADDDGAGFGVIVALLAFLGAALLAVRRQTRE